MLSDVNRIDEKTVELVDPLQGWQRRTCTVQEAAFDPNHSAGPAAESLYNDGLYEK